MNQLAACEAALAAALEKLHKVEAQRDRLADEVRRFEDFSNEVVAHAGDEWDSDEAQESIAIRYVRWLEAERDRLAAACRQYDLTYHPILRNALAGSTEPA